MSFLLSQYYYGALLYSLNLKNEEKSIYKQI